MVLIAVPVLTVVLLLQPGRPRVCGLPVLAQVHPAQLIRPGDSEKVCQGEKAEDGGCPERCPDCDGEGPGQLVSEDQPGLGPGPVPQQTSLPRLQPDLHEDGDGQEPHQAAAPVHSHGVQRVVQLEPEEQEVVEAEEGQPAPGLAPVTTLSLSLTSRLTRPLTCQSSIQGHEKAPGLMEEELVDEEDSETPSGGSEDGVDYGQTNRVSIPWVEYRALRSSIESQEAEYKNESAESRERNGVARKIIDPAVLGEPQGSRTDDETAWRQRL